MELSEYTGEYEGYDMQWNLYFMCNNDDIVP